ncbi:two-component hybrid sensor and regulator [Pseudanabaena sp. lw0831]|uniref:hybrid sensor histidine kinase/response regulator n=1 Tax=Pseudanabaena sp. lw0831 TaxID=1357935 RepID=UPI001916A1C0|nr:hybrid sensor histidine kinase/response regulator [Pseudanabaena sp. lw0831]GBO55555.1 two-component hybrid sensor and regulator [Pseudanabaena sp. lw0831]
MNAPSILIVDDEPNNFAVIAALLSDCDYQIHYASSGQQALSSLDIYNPDLILLDVMMPGINGIQVCQQIKAMPKWQAIPIVMVTALSSKSDLANCLGAGADDFISKPVNPEELRARIKSMLRIKKQFDKIQSLSQIQENTIDTLKISLGALRGNLASNLSHELNTPLYGIIAPIELIKDFLKDMKIAPALEMLDIVEQSASRIEMLTKRLLVYFELEAFVSKQHPVKPMRTKFSSTAIETTLRSQAQSSNRSNDLVFSLEDAEIALSEQYLSTLLYELVDNALKFSSSGTSITVSSQIEGDMLKLSVLDLGRGMTEEQIAKIDAFIQFERETYEQQGTGLGLTISRKIAELTGGQFWITSVYRHETKVHLTLPLARS